MICPMSRLIYKSGFEDLHVDLPCVERFQLFPHMRYVDLRRAAYFSLSIETPAYPREYGSCYAIGRKTDALPEGTHSVFEVHCCSYVNYFLKRFSRGRALWTMDQVNTFIFGEQWLDQMSFTQQWLDQKAKSNF
ncbi:uncharacterized protein LOC111204524 [Brassica napus]|uniref:uncharacterized protein LOC111204524 n=1 Tax=Brassica napus TaxID=3708 RepID=UPI000BBF039B|nr:uncharacterized protein LOC111204524 [Brassica napus]